MMAHFIPDDANPESAGPLYVGVTVVDRGNGEFESDCPIVLLEFTQQQSDGDTRLFMAILPIEEAQILATDIMQSIKSFFGYLQN